MIFSAVINKSVRGFLRKGLYFCGKVGIAGTLFSESFDVLIGYRVQTQTETRQQQGPLFHVENLSVRQGKIYA